MTKIQVGPNKWFNVDAIQELTVAEVTPEIKIVVVWPTGAQMLIAGDDAKQVLEAWGCLDESGNLPESVALGITAQKLGAGGAGPNGNHPGIQLPTK